MRRLISHEVFKLRTTPASWVTLAITLGLAVASVISNILVPVPAGGPPFGSVDHVNHALSVAALTSMVMLTIGILVMAGEYRHGTILQTYLGEPRRGRVLVAKLATVAGLGALLGAVVFGIAYAVAVAVYAANGVRTLPVDLAQLWLGATLASAVYALLGVALGSLTRNTVAAILGGIGWAMIIENGILQSVVPDVAKWLPTGAGVAVTSVGSTGNALLSPGLAAVVLVAWAAVISGTAARFTLTREAH
jgi:ABC-type transport system involved in multi-copper enzyme maturation permease subunit